jgi:hypothetical protein
MCAVRLTLTYRDWLQKIEKPLASLLADLVIPPTLATLILDTDVGEPWIVAIGDFERRLETAQSRARVKAARDVTEVAEGLRIVVSIPWALACQCLRCYLEDTDRLVSGCDQTSRLLSWDVSANPCQRHRKYAGHTDVHSAQISASLRFPSSARI